jgi:hypothetical protein
MPDETIPNQVNQDTQLCTKLIPDIPDGNSKQPKFLRKTLRAIELVNSGCTPKEALQATNGRRDISRFGEAKFKSKLRQYSLTAPQTVKLAHNVITDILAGNPQVEMRRKEGPEGEVVETKEVFPSWSNRATIAMAVYDRFEPLRGQDQAGATTINIVGNTFSEEAGRRIAEAMQRVQVMGQSVDKPVDNSGLLID